MISFEQARDNVLKKYPALKPTGYAYTYDGNYYIELCSKNDKPVFDNIRFVDGNTGAVRVYNPFIDGFHDLKKIEVIE